MKRLWSILCEGYIKKFCLLYILLFLVEVITVMLTKHVLQLSAGVVYLWIIPGFFTVIHLHRKRIRDLKTNGIASRIRFLPFKQSTIYFSEFLFIFSTMVLLVVVQYLVWPIAFWTHHSRLLDMEHQFFFYTAANYMMGKLAPFGWRSIGVVIFLLVISLVLTFIISKDLLGKSRMTRSKFKKVHTAYIGNHALVFVVVSLLLFTCGIGGYQWLYQGTKFSIQTIHGDSSLLHDVSIQLSYQDIKQIDVRLEGQDTKINIKDYDWRWDKDGFFQMRTYAYETENGEWIEEESEDETCVKKMQNLEKAVLSYEFQFFDETIRPRQLFETEVVEYSDMDHYFQLSQLECKGEENLILEKKNHQGEYESAGDVTPLERMKRYAEDTFYFVPRMEEHSMGNASLYRLIKTESSFTVEEVAKLDKAYDAQGCLLIQNQILVVGTDTHDMIFLLYDQDGKLVKEQRMDAALMPFDAKYYVSNRTVLWQKDRTIYMLDTDTMTWKQETVTIGPIIALSYKDDILWIISYDQKDGAYQHINIRAQKENRVLYEGRIQHIKTGWHEENTVEVYVMDGKVE